MSVKREFIVGDRVERKGSPMDVFMLHVVFSHGDDAMSETVFLPFPQSSTGAVILSDSVSLFEELLDVNPENYECHVKTFCQSRGIRQIFCETFLRHLPGDITKDRKVPAKVMDLQVTYYDTEGYECNVSYH